MLQAWETQHGIFNDFELIISDDGSSDGTEEAVIEAKKHVSYPVTFISHKDEGFRIARAKNDAIRAARGDYILVMDGDTFPGKDTVKAFLPNLNPETILHAKRWRVDRKILQVPYSFQALENYKTRQEWRAEKLPDIPPGFYLTFSGANCIIPAKIAKDFLWAPDDWDGYGYDDYNLALRLITTGKKIKFVDSVAWHLEHANSPGDPKTHKRIRELEMKLAPKLKKIYGLAWKGPYL